MSYIIENKIKNLGPDIDCECWNSVQPQLTTKEWKLSRLYHLVTSALQGKYYTCVDQFKTGPSSTRV